MAVGIVPLDRIITGQELVPGDVVIGLESNGIHSNGLTLARHVLFERAGLSIDHVFPELGTTLGEELLRPTLIYVPEILDIIEQVPTVKALINITGDGLLNLPRVAAKVGFEIDDLPPPPPIFRLIQQHGAVANAEMFEVYNMGVGFCVLVAERDREAALSILRAPRPACAGHRPGHRGRQQGGLPAARAARRSWQGVHTALRGGWRKKLSSHDLDVIPANAEIQEGKGVAVAPLFKPGASSGPPPSRGDDIPLIRLISFTSEFKFSAQSRPNRARAICV